MERIISEEDRIRRAEEVASRRRNRIPAESINVPTNNKPSLMRKLFCQVLSSICIFGILYFLSQNNSQAMELIKPVLSEWGIRLRFLGNIKQMYFLEFS